MDQLRDLASLTFKQRVRFTNLAPESNILDIIELSGPEPSYTNTPTPESSLLARLTAPPPPGPSLRLVVIPRHQNDEIQLSKGLFRTLVDHFAIEPLILQQVGLSGYGFSYYERPYKSRFSFYIGTYVYSLFWSFDPSTMQTNAILLLRTLAQLEKGERAKVTLEDVLRRYGGRIHTPLFLCGAVSIHFYRLLEEAVYYETEQLREIESTTGHGPTGAAHADQAEKNIQKLSEAAQKVAITQVHLSNLLRQGIYMNSIVTLLEDEALCSTWHQFDSPEYATKAIEDYRELTSMLPIFKRCISSAEPSVRYLQDRARGQFTVLSGLMTHEDAQTNIDLAQTSSQMAEAAKKDSSAMKSIAVMTMLFLPGTFFAALFAMPAMPEYGQKNFWLYWALSIICTIVVFGFWAIHHLVWKPKRSSHKSEKSRQPAQEDGKVDDDDVALVQMRRSWLGLKSFRSNATIGV